MANIQPSSRAKITVRIWTPFLDSLIERTEAACLRRDLLITRTLELELPRLQSEIPHRNSAKARRYIDSHLKALFASGPGATQLSFALDTRVSGLLESVCDEKNIPREALLNRLLMLLGAPGEFLHEHFFMTPSPSSTEPQTFSLDPEFQQAMNRDLALEMIQRETATSTFDHTFSPLGRIVTIAEDPLRRYRDMLQMLYAQVLDSCRAAGQDTSLLEAERYCYTPFGMPLEDDDLVGLNCYLPDMAITDSPTAAKLFAARPTPRKPLKKVLTSPTNPRSRK